MPWRKKNFYEGWDVNGGNTQKSLLANLRHEEKKKKSEKVRNDWKDGQNVKKKKKKWSTHHLETPWPGNLSAGRLRSFKGKEVQAKNKIFSFYDVIIFSWHHNSNQSTSSYLRHQIILLLSHNYPARHFWLQKFFTKFKLRNKFAYSKSITIVSSLTVTTKFIYFFSPIN